jgi:hypothetical protein
MAGYVSPIYKALCIFPVATREAVGFSEKFLHKYTKFVGGQLYGGFTLKTTPHPTLPHEK